LGGGLGLNSDQHRELGIVQVFASIVLVRRI
jgi:hypothetical protein